MESEPRNSEITLSVFGLFTVIFRFFSVGCLVLILGMRTFAVIKFGNRK